ncbi:MAG: metallophosphoesterase family protein [Treponema sp.]|nr:metallophosphoesterase family protein [Treponema sp.]
MTLNPVFPLNISIKPLSESAFILVISDSHGGVANLAAALEWTRGADCVLDMAVFLGDGYEDLAPASARAGFSLPWHAVRGNGDYRPSVCDSRVLEISGKNPGLSSRKLFLSHGNRYRVEEGRSAIAAAARNAGAEAALFGHTHVPCCRTVGGIFLLNPGSISRPRSSAGCTFAVLECPASGPLSARFFNLTDTCREISVG